MVIKYAPSEPPDQTGHPKADEKRNKFKEHIEFVRKLDGG
jgi:hypothetical protein